MKPFPPGARLALIAGSTALALAGCAVSPTPITDSEVRARITADQFKIYNEQVPIFYPIDLKEALARALKYNLDYRLKMMEQALASGLADVTQFEMLPNLVMSAGYSSRNNDSGGTSVRIDSGAISLVPSTSQERIHWTAGAEFSWNVLDFGVGYFRAKQKANEVLVAEERRRRVIQNILQDVRSAYWRAVGAQRLARDGERLMEKVRRALVNSRQAETEGLVSPKDALTYQRLLLDAVQLLTARRQELEFAKRELAALMNVTPGTDFTLAEPDEPELMSAPQNVAELEELALLNRPELREEDYRERITADEIRRQLLLLLPGISFTYSDQRDSNRYLYNNTWSESGARVTFNLFRALSYPTLDKAQEIQKSADEARRLALSMAILTQVRVAVERYRLALTELEVAKESAQVDQRMASYARAALSTQADAELELIRAETRALNSEFQRYTAYASAQAAFGRIYNSLGLDVVPAVVQGASLAELGGAVLENVQSIERETFVGAVANRVSIPSIRLRFAPPSLAAAAHDDSGRIMAVQPALQQAIEGVLRRNRVHLTDNDGDYLVSFQLNLDAPKNSVRRATWVIRLHDRQGQEKSRASYSSVLAAQPSEKSLLAFSEAAMIANLRVLNQWLADAGKK